MLKNNGQQWVLDLNHELYSQRLIDEVATLFTHAPVQIETLNHHSIIHGEFAVLRSFADFLITQRRASTT